MSFDTRVTGDAAFMSFDISIDSPTRPSTRVYPRFNSAESVAVLIC
jgi:hypothetical protein